MTNSSNTDLLLLHALPLSGQMWERQMMLLPNHTYVPNLCEYSDNIEEWAVNALALTKSEKLIVVGCSVGGSCALQIAKLVPERIAALVLIGTNESCNPNQQHYKKYVEFVENQGVKSAWERYWQPLFVQDNCKGATLQAEKIALNQSIEHLTNGLKAFHTRPNLQATVAESNFPIHVIMGEYDNLPGLSHCQNLAETAKHGSLHIISASGHYAPMTNSQEFNAVLSDIINKHV